ncbi:UNVERIFIED_CONTAM: hypothetical protein Scaly_2944200 [Sesamum calycinum]|uniref:Uncharacterized protein n=1 Tax=Sesamum calycinum TaxID=2727403 RepID=A0AAW2KUN2_9LAMI
MANLTPEFEDSITTFIDGPSLNMHLWMKYYNWTSHGEERVKEYFEAITAPPLQEEQTPGVPEEEGLPVENIDACKNDCMLYWKNDIDLDYCRFCGQVRYKPTRELNPNHKKTLYAILRYLPLTPRLQRLYASEATAEQML